MLCGDLQQPVAASVERGQYGGVYVAAVDALDALHFQLHVVLTCCLAITAFLPAVAVLAIATPLAIVQQHSA